MAGKVEAGKENEGDLEIPSFEHLDLRSFTQDELLAAAKFSDNLAIREEIITPKIDRKVFNESAGSRKQSYNKYYVEPKPSARYKELIKDYGANPRHRDEEGMLKRSSFDSLNDVKENFVVVKRAKLGIKEEARIKSQVQVQLHNQPKFEAQEGHGSAIAKALAQEDNRSNKEEDLPHIETNDPVEAKLLHMLFHMKGIWSSSKKPRKIIDADGFPQGWTVTIGVRKPKNGERPYFELRNYRRRVQLRSPEGKRWPTFKEASAHLVSLGLAPALKRFRRQEVYDLMTSVPGEGSKHPGSLCGESLGLEEYLVKQANEEIDRKSDPTVTENDILEIPSIQLSSHLEKPDQVNYEGEILIQNSKSSGDIPTLDLSPTTNCAQEMSCKTNEQQILDVPDSSVVDIQTVGLPSTLTSVQGAFSSDTANEHSLNPACSTVVEGASDLGVSKATFKCVSDVGISEATFKCVECHKVFDEQSKYWGHLSKHSKRRRSSGSSPTKKIRQSTMSPLKTGAITCTPETKGYIPLERPNISESQQVLRSSHKIHLAEGRVCAATCNTLLDVRWSGIPAHLNYIQTLVVRNVRILYKGNAIGTRFLVWQRPALAGSCKPGILDQLHYPYNITVGERRISLFP